MEACKNAIKRLTGTAWKLRNHRTLQIGWLLYLLCLFHYVLFSKDVAKSRHPPGTFQQRELKELTETAMGENENISQNLHLLNKENFKKMPDWAFNDMYLQDANPRQTTCASSLRNMKDPELRDNFLMDIQVFLQKKHLDMSEWNRLAHFNNPFGFMGFEYPVVKAAVDLIPELPDSLLVPVPPGRENGCISCAVVATGGILNGSRKGKEIDAHDYVFRVNGAVITGHEEDVGNRTSVYVHTAHSIRTSLIIFRNNGFLHIPHDKVTCPWGHRSPPLLPSRSLPSAHQDIRFVLIPEGLRDFYFLESLMKNEKARGGEYKGWTARAYYSGHFDKSNFYVLHPDFLRYIKNRFLRAWQLKESLWAVYRPTNGAFAAFLAMHMCDSVSVYGFSTEENYMKYPNYYFDKKHTKLVFYANHDYKLEMKTWKMLHDKQVIRLFQRKEDQ